MSHFAKVRDGFVVQVIVAEPEFFETFVDTTAGEWLQTSYNTIGGVHTQGGTPLRKNFAGVGYSYDAVNDAFIPPKPFNSWILNQDTFLWESPVPLPTDGKSYLWNEEQLNWLEYSTEGTCILEAPVNLSLENK